MFDSAHGIGAERRREKTAMAMMFLAAVIAATLIASALFGGLVNSGAAIADAMSLALAVATGVAVASASAFDS
jgi:hypothetical protein